MSDISLFMITYNEEKNIAGCIRDVKSLVDEIIVVDSFSSDKTAEIAESLGAKVFKRKFDGFTNQKNYALSLVTKEWALNLDADELITDDLKKDVLVKSEQNEYDGFWFRSRSYFLGRKMNFSGLQSVKKMCLVRAKKARFEGGLVHERLIVDGPTAVLGGHIKHYSYSSLRNYFEKFNKYTSLGARSKYEAGKRADVFLCCLRLPFDFFRRYILQLGILDGVPGLVWCAFSAFYPFVKYMKLWELEHFPED